MDTVTWTDDKIGALAKEVHDGFARAEVEYARTDERFIAINQRLDDLKAGQAQMDDRFEVKFDALNDRFAAMQRTLVQVGFSLVVGLLGGLVALIVAVLATH
jgi:hypothetical protein